MEFRVRRLFSNLFLSVVYGEDDCQIYGRVFRRGKVIKTIEAKFDSIHEKDGEAKVLNYIARQEKNYHDTYVGLFFADGSQGALPTTRQSDFKLYGINPASLSSIVVNDSFSIYADTEALARAKNSLGDIGVDLVYSPIALMYEQILSRKPSDKTSMYIYGHSDSFALGIFKSNELCFATFFKVSDDERDLEDIADSLNSEDITDISNLIATEEDEARHLDDFQSLDDFLKGDDDTFADIDYDINMPESSDVAASVAIFGRDMSIFSYITTAIKEFYHNPIYKGNFIDEIVIFDSAHVSATFLQYLQAELFVEASVQTVNTAKLINDLMLKDINL
ncbi:hypothetical protein [Campylobacter sp. 19-13652]|uniref:hypothetical protein n=1 Tax=Campylobacter sp. 19-13652 TaxID=2840180 RepID=UPI001C791A06|nr:hypothetical protein [Campylobacter sp. 19-13652]BCX79704.1 hypothetical protein LBC_11660 [Campylobacter sp. 19-13652]